MYRCTQKEEVESGRSQWDKSKVQTPRSTDSPHHYISYRPTPHTTFTEGLEKGLATDSCLCVVSTQETSAGEGTKQYSTGKHSQEMRKLFDLFNTTIPTGAIFRVAYKWYPSRRCWAHFMEKFHLRTDVPTNKVGKFSKGYHSEVEWAASSSREERVIMLLFLHTLLMG